MFLDLDLYRESSGKIKRNIDREIFMSSQREIESEIECMIFYGSFPTDLHNRSNLMRVSIEIKTTSINENLEDFELPITLYLSRNICSHDWQSAPSSSDVN